MEDVNIQIQKLERKLKINKRIICIWCFIMGAFVIYIGYTWGKLAPFPKGTNLEFASDNKKSILNGNGLTFYNDKDEEIAFIGAKEKYAPELTLRGNNSEAHLVLYEGGGGELQISKFGGENNEWERKLRMHVSSEDEEVSFLLSSSGCGEAKLGVSKEGEPELILKGAKGGKIEMRINSNGTPVLSMEDNDGKLVYAVPENKN